MQDIVLTLRLRSNEVGLDRHMPICKRVTSTVHLDVLESTGVTLTAGTCDVDQFAQDSELQLELDAVDDTFDGLLNDMSILILHYQKRNIHNDDEHVDAEKLAHDPLTPSISRRSSQNIEGPPEVET